MGGFPLLRDASELHLSQSSMRSRDDEAKIGLDARNHGAKPAPDFAEQAFIQHPIACADGRAAVVLHNAEFRGSWPSVGDSIRLSTASGALHVENARIRNVFMGIEPANCPTIEGRLKAEEPGTLPFLEPGESRRYDLEFRILIQADEIATYLPQIP